ncbi:MAG: sigma-70 family RNA polymerase sigma factor [Pirellulales bacterium]|nr:sigma-70 family RNA polymerase sigma factor [Pirellulales bacterium]
MNAPASHSQVASLLEHAREEGAARDRLLAMYRPYLSVLARQRLPRIVSKRADGSDVVQQTLIDALRGLPGFRGASEPEFTAWMLKLLERNLLQTIRRNTTGKRDVRLEIEPTSASASAQVVWHSLAGDGFNPISSVYRGEAALELCQALERLPADQRTAVERRYLDRLPLNDIAKEMERSVSSVAGLIRRGVEALEAILPAELRESS